MIDPKIVEQYQPPTRNKNFRRWLRTACELATEHDCTVSFSCDTREQVERAAAWRWLNLIVDAELAIFPKGLGVLSVDLAGFIKGKIRPVDPQMERLNDWQGLIEDHTLVPILHRWDRPCLLFSCL